MSSSVWPVQVAVFERLSGALAVPVHDEVPADRDPPYVTIGEDTATDWSATELEGEEVTLTVHVWSIKPGRRETKEIMGQVKDALHLQPLAVAGHGVVLLRWEWAETFLDPDGVTRHGVMRFRALIEEE